MWQNLRQFGSLRRTSSLRQVVLWSLYLATITIQPQTGIFKSVSLPYGKVTRIEGDIAISEANNYHVTKAFEADDQTIAFNYKPVERAKAIEAAPQKVISIPKAQVASSELAQKSVAVAVETVEKPVVITGDVPALIQKYAQEYGVDVTIMTTIATCESGMRPEAANGPYAGVYQFDSSTWSSNRAAMGLDTSPGLRYNAEEAVRTAAFKMSRDGFGAWPACSRKATASIIL